MKRLIFTAAVLLFALNTAAQSYKFIQQKTRLEEKFVYGVSWTFIRLGTITLKVETIDSFPELRKVIVDIKTAAHLPFINIDEYNEAILRISDGMTMYYHGTEKNDGKTAEITCVYNEDQKCAFYESKNIETGEILKKITLKIQQPFLIGTSLIEYARLAADSGTIKKVPTIIKGNIYPTTINYSGPVEEIDIDACDEPVSAFRYTGSADWDGQATAGLSGNFTGWLSNDSADVVLYAELDILLGSVDAELEYWFKPGWTPPVKKKVYAGKRK